MIENYREIKFREKYAVLIIRTSRLSLSVHYHQKNKTAKLWLDTIK